MVNRWYLDIDRIIFLWRTLAATREFCMTLFFLLIQKIFVVRSLTNEGWKNVVPNEERKIAGWLENDEIILRCFLWNPGHYGFIDLNFSWWLRWEEHDIVQNIFYYLGILITMKWIRRSKICTNENVLETNEVKTSIARARSFRNFIH